MKPRSLESQPKARKLQQKFNAMNTVAKNQETIKHCTRFRPQKQECQPIVFNLLREHKVKKTPAVMYATKVPCRWDLTKISDGPSSHRIFSVEKPPFMEPGGWSQRSPFIKFNNESILLHEDNQLQNQDKLYKEDLIINNNLMEEYSRGKQMLNQSEWNLGDTISVDKIRKFREISQSNHENQTYFLLNKKKFINLASELVSERKQNNESQNNQTTTILQQNFFNDIIKQPDVKNQTLNFVTPRARPTINPQLTKQTLILKETLDPKLLSPEEQYYGKQQTFTFQYSVQGSARQSQMDKNKGLKKQTSSSKIKSDDQTSALQDDLINKHISATNNVRSMQLLPQDGENLMSQVFKENLSSQLVSRTKKTKSNYLINLKQKKTNQNESVGTQISWAQKSGNLDLQSSTEYIRSVTTRLQTDKSQQLSTAQERRHRTMKI